jgi:hypothetical protein
MLTLNNLIDPDTGETNRAVLKAMVRRRAFADFGCLSPRSIRQALKFYSCHIDQQKAAWRMSRGLPVETVMITPYGKQVDGLRWSAF